MLTGKTLVNLDSEDWPIIYIGCAGAGDTNVTLDVSLSAAAVPQGAKLYKVSVRLLCLFICQACSELYCLSTTWIGSKHT